MQKNLCSCGGPLFKHVSNWTNWKCSVLTVKKTVFPHFFEKYFWPKKNIYLHNFEIKKCIYHGLAGPIKLIAYVKRAINTIYNLRQNHHRPIYENLMCIVWVSLLVSYIYRKYIYMYICIMMQEENDAKI